MRLSKKASYGLDYTAMQFSPQGWGRLNKFVYSYFYSVINIHLQKLKGGGHSPKPRGYTQTRTFCDGQQIGQKGYF